jgi:hypothetical protein
MFDIPVNKIGELDEYDFENLVSILESDSLEEWFSERHLDDPEEISVEPPNWLKEWLDFLQIHSLCYIDNGIVWTELNLIEDAREGVFFIFHKDNDNCSLGDRTPRLLEDQSTEVVWSLVKEYFDGFGESVLYGTLEIHDTALLPQVLLEPYLVEKMAAEGIKKLGHRVSLKSWIKSNYR